MIQATHANIMNCSPIKPHSQSFGNKQDVMKATTEWLEDIQDGNISEGQFRGLENVADQMHDGPFKTFVKILSIGGGAFVATKIGSTKLINTLSNNTMVANNVVKPLSKYVKKGLDIATTKLESSTHFGEMKKGIKPLIVNSLDKAIKEIKMYGKRGAEEIEANLSAQIKDKTNFLKKEGLEEVTKLKINKEITALKERKELAATENLIKKVTSTTAGAGAGTIAVVEANRDENGNGIADIAEHSAA